jgi:hypothetical protein
MGKNQDPGSGIRDKHPGSATLAKTTLYGLQIANQQNWHIFGILQIKKII